MWGMLTSALSNLNCHLQEMFSSVESTPLYITPFLPRSLPLLPPFRLIYPTHASGEILHIFSLPSRGPLRLRYGKQQERILK